MIQQKSSSMISTTILVIIIAFVSRLLGFLREVLIGNYFGTSKEADAYFIALTIPTILFTSVVTAIGTSYIPIYSEINEKKGNKHGLMFTNRVINIVLILSIVLTLVGSFFTDVFVSLIAIGFDESTYKLAVSFTRLSFPMIVFIGLTTVYSAFLNANKQFIIPSAVVIPNNIIIIFSLVASPIFGIEGVIAASVIGMVCQSILLYKSIKSRGYFYNLSIGIRDEYIKKMGKLIFPIFIGSTVQQLNTFVDRMLASGAGAGSIAALNYGQKVNGFIVGIISLSIASVVYPMLADANSSKNIDFFKKTMNSSINSISLLVTPLAVTTAILSIPIVQFLFERGVFNKEATIVTGGVLFYLSFGMLFYNYKDILNKVFYALHDTKTPMINGVIAIGINILLSVVLVRKMGINGIALANSISSLISTLLLFYNLKNRIIDLEFKPILSTFLKVLLATGVMGIVVHMTYKFSSLYLTRDSFVAELVKLSFSIGSGLFLYLLFIYFLKIDEFKIFSSTMKSKIYRNK
ncbi:murein biosynthesis integral membrane protein MurJ [Bacillus sp. S35]|nr:murein biosynthesis integral membrane protein MurJ [Bacillus sp. S35]